MAEIRTVRAAQHRPIGRHAACVSGRTSRLCRHPVSTNEEETHAVAHLGRRRTATALAGRGAAYRLASLRRIGLERHQPLRRQHASDSPPERAGLRRWRVGHRDDQRRCERRRRRGRRAVQARRCRPRRGRHRRALCSRLGHDERRRRHAHGHGDRARCRRQPHDQRGRERHGVQRQWRQRCAGRDAADQPQRARHHLRRRGGCERRRRRELRHLLPRQRARLAGLRPVGRAQRPARPRAGRLVQHRHLPLRPRGGRRGRLQHPRQLHTGRQRGCRRRHRAGQWLGGAGERDRQHAALA